LGICKVQTKDRKIKLATESKIDFLENYVEWANERKLFPPTFSPTEYAEHLRNMRNSDIIDRALEMVGAYEMSETGWPREMVEKMAKILRDEA
jgi:hypothetical protein